MKRERIIQQLEMQLAVIKKEAVADHTEYVSGYWEGRYTSVEDSLRMLRDE